jgi:4a-hydroxytetrahydrobiopterin dehydratase
MVSVLSNDDLNRRLDDLPGVVRDRLGTLTLSVRAPSFPAAVELIRDVADVAERMDHHPEVDLRWRTIVFTFSTHSAGGVTQLDLDLARQVLDAATRAGAETLPAAQRVEIVLDVVDPGRVRAFWAAGLGYATQSTGGIQQTEGIQQTGDTPQTGDTQQPELQDPSGRGPVLWFQRMDPARTERGRFHLDVYLPDEDGARRRLDACLASGGRLVTDAHAPSWWVLADPEGNELCLCTRAADPLA